MALSDLSPNNPAVEELNEIRSSAVRAANLTRQLLIFSRREIINLKIVNLNKILFNLDKMLRRLINENIELVAIPGENLWPVMIDPGQMEQVLTNLVVNARDAMPEGGKLTIETDNVYLDEEYTRTHNEVEPGDYVKMTVSDTGTGMDREIQTHIFEPFFTTKEVGKGTGLGLSTCYGIVKQNNGSIWVYSEPGHGTSMKIYLPKTEKNSSDEMSAKPSEELAKGTETILVVEDEPLVRNMIIRSLQKQGYKTLEASHGEEAIATINNCDSGIDLIISDLIMPRMGGKELSEYLANNNPNIKTLFMSGYTDNTIVHHGKLDDGISFIQKPFSPSGILKKVRQMLDE